MEFDEGPPPIRYESVETALAALAVEVKARNAIVHMPRIVWGVLR